MANENIEVVERRSGQVWVRVTRADRNRERERERENVSSTDKEVGIQRFAHFSVAFKGDHMENHGMRKTKRFEN